MADGTHRYDVILDCVGNYSLTAFRRMLNPGGRNVAVGGPNGRWIGPLARGIASVVLSQFTSGDMRMILTKPNRRDLTTLRDLKTTGPIVPVIDRRYPLHQVADAVRYLEAGHASGKIVIVI